MIKIHEIEKAVKQICQDSYVLDKFDNVIANDKIETYLAKIKSDFHHIEYDVNNNEVKLLLYTTHDDGYDLSFKITTLKN